MRSHLAVLAAILALVGPAAAQAPATPPAPTAADWRAVDPENVLVIDTTQGRVLVELSPEIAPASVERIKTLTRRKFYNGLTFFRVIDDFMAQTGDPENRGTGGSDLPNLDPEFTFQRGRETVFNIVKPDPSRPQGFVGSVPVVSQSNSMMVMMASGKVSALGMFCPGVVGFARSEEPDSGNSQFFLMRQREARLDGKYTPFGMVLSGLDVVRKIKVGEPPAEPYDRMIRVQVMADIPAVERPTIQVQDTGGAAFRAYADRVRATKGADFTVCDLEIPVQVR